MSERMTDLERAREILAGYPLETAQHVIAEALAAARREGAEEARKQTDAVIQGFAHRWMETGAADMRERAAQVVEDYFNPETCGPCAAAIRALKDTP